MGLLSSIFALFRKKKKPVKLIFCGLDNSGKTTILNYLKLKKAQQSEVVPTVGFSVENFEKENLSFTVFDMSGQGKYRSLWESFYGEVHGIVFVIDSADRIRMAVAKNELETLLEHNDLSLSIPILFFANKQDLQSSMTAAEISNALELHELRSNPWSIIPSDAVHGDGIHDGLKWLSQALDEKDKKK